MSAGDPAVIRTKLVPPVRDAGLVARDRLLTRLSDAIDRAVVVIKAPAGYGKTTLVGQWFATLNPATQHIAWYSLDDADNDLGRFFTYLVAALRLRVRDFGDTVLGQLNAGVRPSSASLSGAFLNEIAALGKRVNLVLDDFHLLHKGDVGDAMREIVGKAPADLHLVVAGRETPPLPLGRLRALGRVVEITDAELRFRGPETSCFLSLAGHTALSPRQIHILEQRTEGWAAGLQLASISLMNRDDVDEFIRAFSGSHRDVADFLTEDVLQRQDQETREFLIHTSVLERLCPSLCDAVTGAGHGRRMLDTLESRSLFLFSLDSEREWYRYHHLFAEFLLKRLKARDPELVRNLYRRASRWFAKESYLDEAIQYAISGEDWPNAAKSLSLTCDDLFYSGRLGALAEWFGQIPIEYLRRYPRILLDQAWSLVLEWRFAAARRMLDNVGDILAARERNKGRTDEIVRLQAMLKHREMMYAQFRDDMPLVAKLCLEMFGHFPIEDPYLQGNLYSSYMNAQRDLHDFGQVDALDAQALDHYERSGSRFVLIWHHTILGMTRLAEGKLEQGERALSFALSVAKEISGEVSPLAAMPGLLLAEVCYEQNRIREAAHFLERYLPLVDQIGFVDQLIAGYLCQSRLAAAGGDRAEAQAMLDEAGRHAVTRSFDRLKVYVEAERIRQALRATDFETAVACGARSTKLSAEEVMPASLVRNRDAQLALTWCRLASVSGLLEDAVGVSRRWFRFTRGRGAIRSAVEFGLLLGHTLQRRGERTAAQRSLRETLGIAANAGIKRTLMDAPELTGSLLACVVHENGDLDDPPGRYARALLADMAPQHAVDQEVPLEQVCADMIYSGEPLRRREREILELVSAGLLNREIADRLGLTEGSVKWYLQQIYDKVGTRRRTQAVQRARDLGLLR